MAGNTSKVVAGVGDGAQTAPSPIQTDNTPILRFLRKTLQPKATESIEMNYWFMDDR